MNIFRKGNKKQVREPKDTPSTRTVRIQLVNGQPGSKDINFFLGQNVLVYLTDGQIVSGLLVHSESKFFRLNDAAKIKEGSDGDENQNIKLGSLGTIDIPFAKVLYLRSNPE